MPSEHSELLLEAERALGAWAVGDLEFHVAIQRACGGFAIAGQLSCALVYVDGSSLDVIGSADAERRPELLRRVAMVATRDFITPADPRWSGIVGKDVDMIPSVTPWIACEPVIQGPGLVQSVLVMIGGEETPRDLSLSALMRLARWCGAVLAQERARITGAHVVQRVGQVTTNLSKTIDHACACVDPSHHETLEALDHARDLVTQLQRQVIDIERLLPRR